LLGLLNDILRLLGMRIPVEVKTSKTAAPTRGNARHRDDNEGKVEPIDTDDTEYCHVTAVI
jgi:hypothetical protein